jgi:transposase
MCIKNGKKRDDIFSSISKESAQVTISGESYIKLSARFKISTTTISRWKKELNPKRRRNKKPIKIDNEVLKKDIEDYPDSYSYERAKRLGVSASGIKHAKKTYWSDI